MPETSPRQQVFALATVFIVGCVGVFGLLHEGGVAGGAAFSKEVSLARGLVGYWRFDGDGALVIDDSGNGNTGVFVNSGLASGRLGQALALKGSEDSHVSIPATASLDDFSDQMTVSAWVYPKGRPKGFITVASRQIGTQQHPDQFYLGFGPRLGIMGYKWHIGTIEGGQVHDVSVYAGFPAANRWIHMAGVYDGKTLRLYVDGREIGRLPQTGRIQVDDNPVTIGGEENGPEPLVVDGEFNGLIDDVRLYNRALSPAEITALYNQPPE